MFQLIWKDIMHLTKEYLGQGLIFALVGLVLMSIAVYTDGKIKGQQNTKLKAELLYKGFFWYLFLLYIYMVLAVTIFSREASPTPTIDLKLFCTFYNNQVAKMYIYENILMFLPLGIFVYCLFENLRKVYTVVFLGIFCSLVIEVAQYITRRGKFQVDDMLNNVVGILIGYGMSICMVKLVKHYSKNHI